MLFRKVRYGVALLFVVSVLAACSSGDPKLAWEQISSEKTILLDVRSQQEFDEGHLEGAILIPVGDLEDRMSELGDNKDAPIVTYCKRGIRSERAKGLLEEHGFTNVLNGGGYKELLATKGQ